ncbi:hypothetical protein ACTFIV_001486 [Dictyostelium citrinum]
MNIKIIIITFLFFLSTVKVNSRVDLDTTTIFSNQTFLSYQFQSGSDYFTSINFEHYEGPSFELNFTCINSNGTFCYSQINEENKKQLYGKSITYTSQNNPQKKYRLDPEMYPTPIVSSPFQPPTKGGLSILNGTYLTFFEKLTFYQLINPKNPKINIIDSIPFDAINVKVNCPPGCGYQLIQWENGNLFNFSYSNPSVSNVKITSSNIIVNGSDFCDSSYSSNITIDGVIIPTSNYSKDEDSIIIKYIQQHTTKSLMEIETSNVTSTEIEIVFKPEPLLINSVPFSKGGLIIIEGLRLSSKQINNNHYNNITVKIGNITCLNAVSISTDSITCYLNAITNNLPLSQSNNLPVSVTINNITNENSLLFNFGIVQLNPNKYSLPDRVLQLNGYCLGNSNNTIIYLNGKETMLNDLKINNEETTLSFKIPEEFKSKLNVSVKVNNVLSNEIQIDITFYASYSNQQPSTNGNSNIIFTLYNIKSENYNKIPSITIHPDQSIINGVSINSSNNQDIHSYSFSIPSGCGKKEINITIGSQSCLSSITYSEPIINNCFVSNYDGKNGNIICDGNFGNKDYFDQSSVIFSNDEIVPPSINSKTLSFPLISGYHSDDLIFQMCGIQSKPFKLNISPSLKTIDSSQIETIGGKFFILGEFFSSNINCSVFCNDREYQSFFENSTTISFDLQIPGPNDILCNYTFDNGKNSSYFKIQYPFPSIENTSSINTNGGNLTIFGKNFYNISNIKVEVDNQLNCINIDFIDSNTLSCFLPPFNESLEQQESFFGKKLLLNNSTIINSKKLLLKVTFDSKTWSGYIFQYSKEDIQIIGNSDSSTNKILNPEKINISNNNKKKGVYLSRKSKILLSILLPFFILSIVSLVIFIYVIRTKRIKRNEYVRKVNNLKLMTPEEKRIEREQENEIKKRVEMEMFELKCNLLCHTTQIFNSLSDRAWREQQMKENQKNNESNQFQQPNNKVNSDEGSSQQFQSPNYQTNEIYNDEGSIQKIQQTNNQVNVINSDEGSSQQFQSPNF